jgi:adenine C2-methylase RlmN of 23S rRNA A2503 and tRNA A37
MAACYRPTLAPVPARYDLDRDALARLLAGEPRYRIDQVWDGLYRQLATPSELTALPRPRRQRRLRDELVPINRRYPLSVLPRA